MNGLQVAALLGLVLGGGIAGAIWALIPAQPDLGDVLARLSPATRQPASATPSSSSDAQERLGIWAERRLPARLLGSAPVADLAVLRISTARFYGKKLTYGLLGLALPALLGAFAILLGFHVPVVAPAGVALVAGAAMYAGAGSDIAREAGRARDDATRALVAFVELCAQERASGSGAGQAMTRAAAVGDSWLFVRIREQMARAGFDRQQPWDALDHLARTLAIPPLADVADIMRLAGDENTRAYEQLRARAESMRTLLQASDETKAGLVEDRMYIPAALITVVFLSALIFPPLLRLMAG